MDWAYQGLFAPKYQELGGASWRKDPLAEVGAVACPGVKLPGCLIGAVVVVGVLKVGRKALAQLMAGVSMGIAHIAVRDQVLRVTFAKLPVKGGGLFGQWLAIHQLRFVIAEYAGIELFGESIEGRHFCAQVGVPDVAQFCSIQPDSRFNIIIVT